MSLIVRAPAKINLRLGVGPLREDGFHALDTVYQAIGLYDDVQVEPAEQWSLTLEAAPGLDASQVPLDERNLALQAARALTRHHDVSARAHVHIVKGIPVAGGLAGGSADAAATLVALDRLWDLQTSDEDLLALAAGLGSDVPFALVGGTAAGTGRGERVQRLDDHGTAWWVVVPSHEGLSTPTVFAEYDRLGLPADDSVWRAGERGTAPDLEGVLRTGDPALLADALGNDLTEPALSLRPDLRRTLDDGREAGALAALLSGSGPTCLFLCRDAVHATAVRIGLLDRGHERVESAAGPVAGAHVVRYE
ncbi:4-(cytidine 5'-diphospho)-2-C-methyl-D-erythritol kinase [Alteromonas gracilis]